MKKVLIISTALVVSLAACNKQAKENFDLSKENTRVKALDSNYSHQISEQHADSFVNVFLADAIIQTPGEDELKGIRAISDWYANAFEYGLKSCEFNTTSITGDEQHLIETGKSKVGLLIGDADTLIYEHYKYLHVWQKQANGVYKLSRAMWNADAEKLETTN